MPGKEGRETYILVKKSGDRVGDPAPEKGVNGIRSSVIEGQGPRIIKGT